MRVIIYTNMIKKKEIYIYIIFKILDIKHKFIYYIIINYKYLCV